ncbi:MAG TPA: hypothetical protein V6D12_03275 [Candidatus Obscuribacterales bacterium]
MNQKRRSRGVRPSKGGIERLEQAKEKGRDDEGKQLTFERIAGKAQVSDKTVKRLFNGDAVDPSSAVAIIEALGLKKEEVLSSEESLVVESIERIEARSAELERPGTHSERAGKATEELQSKLKGLKKSTEDSYQAMYWLQANQKALAQEAAKAALKEHYNQPTASGDADDSEKVDQFAKDIGKYLQLLYYSLEQGTWKLIEQAIQESVIPLNLESKFYAKALIFIKDQRVAKELPPEAAKELTLCLDYLINIIPIRF